MTPSKDRAETAHDRLTASVVIKTVNEQPLAFRVARREDAAAVHAIRVAAADELTHRHGDGRWARVTPERILRKHIASKNVHVAECGEALATYALKRRRIGFYDPAWFAHPGDDAIYLTDMAVRPDIQRRGVGRAVMAAIDEFARSLGCGAVRFDAYDAAAGAGRFYEKCGYTCVHRGSVNGVGLEYFEKVLR